MTLTVVFNKSVPIGGGVKKAWFKITDSDGGGGDVDLSPYFNHILNVNLVDTITAKFISTLWTDDAETVTIGAEGSASDIYMLSVEGW